MLKSGLFWTAVLPTPLFLATLFLGKLWPQLPVARTDFRFDVPISGF